MVSKHLRGMLCLVFVAAGCGKKAGQRGSSSQSSTAEQVSSALNYRKVSDTLAVAGQPSQAALSTLKDQGIEVVVNLRPDSELKFDEKAVVEGQGVEYVHIPVSSIGAISADDAKTLDKALAGDKNVLAHCGTSNRVGALFAVRAATLKGKSIDDALAIGRKHGLKSEDAARKLLESDLSMVGGSMSQELQSRLSAALGAAMGEGGFESAVDVCSNKAQELTSSISTDSHTIRRVGTRIRNPKNTPSEELANVVATLTKDTPVKVTEVAGKQTYVKGIFVGKMCLSCHGTKDNLGEGVADMLAKKYPDDEATGYSLGDLRGAFVVQPK